MNMLVKILERFGLLTEDLDYHILRASMVIIFPFFGYQKWFEYEARVLIPYISWPSHLLVVSRLRYPGGELVPGMLRMAHLRASVRRVLGQESWDPWCH